MSGHTYRLVNKAGDQIGPCYETKQKAVDAREAYSKYRFGKPCTYRIQEAKLELTWKTLAERL